MTTMNSQYFFGDIVPPLLRRSGSAQMMFEIGILGLERRDFTILTAVEKDKATDDEENEQYNVQVTHFYYSAQLARRHQRKTKL